MPKKDGLQVVAELMSGKASKPQIIVMAGYESEYHIRQAMGGGVRGFLDNRAHPQQIREAVCRVAQGERFLPAEIALKLAESVSRPELSKREAEVLKYLARGRSNKEIGRALSISEGTVKHHVSPSSVS
jgi:two-component system, NarL family, response regulator